MNIFEVNVERDASQVLDTGQHRVRAELDRMILSADERRWDPAEIDLSTAYDPDREGIMPDAWFPELRTSLAGRLSDRQRHRLGNEVLRWFLSGILHGEQAALNVCAQLGASFTNPIAQAFIANQVGEEARHVAAFARYLDGRWGPPYRVGEAFGGFLNEVIGTDDVARKMVGICVLVEGFAMGAFANIHAHARDPALKAMLRNVMRDEAVHHNFGLMWMDHALATLSNRDVDALGNWAIGGFRALYLNLVSIRQRRAVFAPFGLDWRAMRAEVRAERRLGAALRGLEEDLNPLSVLARALNRNGLLSKRARARLARWLDAHGRAAEFGAATLTPDAG